MMRDVTRKPVDFNMPNDDDDDDGLEVNVVDVLRLLTALEERLGSLGPKVIDLLAQALALEKNEANSSESLLDNDINCVLFETVKEKLKGQLFAGLVDMLQERAFKRAIKKIASLMHMAGQRKRQRDKLLPKMTPVSVSGVVDKAAIAKQIANALVAQGKTDVSQDELETLINAVVGMAEASRNSSKPMTTANFLQILGSGNGERDAQEKITPSSSKKLDIVDLEKLTEPLTPSPGKNSASNMENLSDSDLQTLLQNFKDLSTEEQHNLINYLKKLEYQEPERVERLRKFVNLEPGDKPKDDDNKEADEDAEVDGNKNKANSGRESPFSNRSGPVNPDHDLVDLDSDEDNEKDEKMNEDKEKKIKKKVHVDSEDEYSFEDVVKSVSKNVKDKEMEHSKKVLEDTMKYDKSKSEGNLNTAKDLISNLMANISKTNSSSSSVDLLGLGSKSVTSNPPTNMANVDFTKLGDIGMSNLASILSNFKNLTSPDTTEKKIDFQPPSPVKNVNKMNFDLSNLDSNGKKIDFQSPVLGKNVNKLNLDLTSLKSKLQENVEFRDQGINKGPMTLNLLDRDRSKQFEDSDPSSRRNFDGPEFDRSRFSGPERFGPGGPGGSAGPDRFGPGGPDGFGPGAPDRFGPGAPDRFGMGGPDRFGIGGPDRSGIGGPDRFSNRGPDRFGTGGPDRFGTGGQDRFDAGGPDRFGISGPDRFGAGGPDRFGAGGPDRFDIGVPDRFGSGGPDRFGPVGSAGGPDRFGPVGSSGGPDRFGPVGSAGGSERFGPIGSERLGGPGGNDKYGGFGASDRGFGGPDRGFGGPDRGFGGPDRGFGGPDRGFGGPDRGYNGPDRSFGQTDRGFGSGHIAKGPPSLLEKNVSRMAGSGPGLGMGSGPGAMDPKGPGNFGNRKGPPFGTDSLPRGGPQRPGPDDQRNFQRLPAPDFNRPGNFGGRW
ncbi:unnamed protein product [Psylliodes chrysocephalus]|uniref:Uncharacterized protein n=2 Tax=Psylliodes chrysocephalus TaxID=3402493 RepID=A0A9P0CQR9_9CUCU|nr:unnamed protein product [Psylliodes chrysocephala]